MFSEPTKKDTNNVALVYFRGGAIWTPPHLSPHDENTHHNNTMHVQL